MAYQQMVQNKDKYKEFSLMMMTDGQAAYPQAAIN
jgi:hypothetical protein